MQISTLIIGYTPLPKDLAGYKPAQIRADKYFVDFLAGFNLDTLHFAKSENYKEALDVTNPLITIVFDDYYAKQITEYKKDTLIYVTDHPGSVFHRKKDIESKQEKQLKIFKEIEGLIQQAKDGGAEQEKTMRQFAAMSYQDLYEMIKQAIISDKPDLQKKAWNLLNSNEVHKDFIWMRANIVVDCWQAADAKGKEEFLTLAMEQHIKNRVARRLEDFTELDGVCYKQYEFIFSNDVPTKYIRRIPIATKGMDKWAYQSLLEKYDTPKCIQMLVEVGKVKTLFEQNIK